MACTGIAAALVLALTRPAMTESPGSTVKAPFKVIDDKGKTRLLVEALPKVTRLQVWDYEGAARHNLVCGPGISGKKEASLAIFDEKGVPVVSIGTNTLGD